MISNVDPQFTVLHLFSGSGGGALGFKRAGFLSLGSIDLDRIACGDLERLTGERAIVADLAAMDPADLAAAIGACPDVVFTSPPCLPADGVVLTEAGPRRIDTVQVGDRVLSHKGRYCRVDKINTRNYVGDLHGLRVNGSLDTQWYTSEHPVWVRRVVRGTDKTRTLRELRWSPAQEVRVGDRVGFPVPPVNEGAAARFVGQFGDPQVYLKGGTNEGRYCKPAHSARSKRVVDLRGAAGSTALWTLLGAYIGDGDRRHDTSGVRFSVGARGGRAYKVVVWALEELGLSWHVTGEGDTNVRIGCSSRHLSMLCAEFGSDCYSKHIPEQLFGLDDPQLAALLFGLRVTDGCELGDYGWSVASTSLQLLRDLQRAMLRFGKFGGIHTMLHAGKGVIEGREVHISNSYKIEFINAPEKTCYTFEDGVLWQRVKKIETKPYAAPVWNLEVDEDDTYCSPLIATHNCKGYSGCLPEGTAKTAKYIAYNNLALHGVWLTLEAWAPRLPKYIILENVPRIRSRGREWLTHLGALLHHYGYAVEMSTHNCGEVGGLAQNRERFLLVARQRDACPDFLRHPPAQRVRTVGEALFHLPSPAAMHGDKLHKLPRLSAMNQLRLAAIRAGKDWRDLPAEIRIGQAGTTKSRHAGKLGVEDHDAQAHTVIGRGSRPGSTWCSVTDPRVGVDPSTAPRGSWAAKGRPDAYGVQDPNAPGTTVRARQEVQTSRRSVADPRVADPQLTKRAARQNGGFGVNDHRAGAHTVVGAATVRSAWASVADPRLTCAPRSGAYGMLDADEVGPTIIGYHKHDRAPASVADPRLAYRRGGDEAAGKHSGRGCYGVLDPDEPAPTIRGRHTVRQAPAALCDWRGWPIATHELHRDEDGGLTLYGPELDLEDTRPRSDIVIRAPDGTWHRPMTTRELACLQGFPDNFVFEGSDSSSKTQPGIREHIGNAVPPPAAEAIAREVMAALIASHDGGWRLSNSNIWVRPEMEWAA